MSDRARPEGSDAPKVEVRMSHAGRLHLMWPGGPLIALCGNLVSHRPMAPEVWDRAEPRFKCRICARVSGLKPEQVKA